MVAGLFFYVICPKSCYIGVKVYQDSLVSDVISSLEMTGKRVQVSVTVSDGLPYAFDNQTMFEHVSFSTPRPRRIRRNMPASTSSSSTI